MRNLIIAISIAVFAAFLATKAEAGLIEDLRSGKSDVKASSTSAYYLGIVRYWKQQKSAPDFKAIVTARSNSYALHGAGSAEQAVEAAIRYCKEQGGGRTRCEVYAAGDAVVEGYSQDELADAIEAYNSRDINSTDTPTTAMLIHLMVSGSGL